MDRWQYTMVLTGCIALTLPLELVIGARVYRRPRQLAATLAPVLAVFAVWDMVAAERGHWWWSPDLIIGARVLGVPLEEWLFFLVIPVCAVLTYEALGARPSRRPPTTTSRAHPGRPAPKSTWSARSATRAERRDAPRQRADRGA